jgi:2,5-diketo-D-gluconate reductase A
MTTPNEAMATVPEIELNNGVTIPQLGFGVYQVPPEETAENVRTALEIGYRHVDTAEMYGNEAGVAQGIADSGIPRSELFITSKINNGFHGYEKTLAAFDQSLRDLRIDRIDLILIHWPLPEAGDFLGTWKALEKVYEEGRARAIGVSNFQAHHIERLLQETTVVPAVNQIELHPYLTQEAMREVDDRHGIATEAWSPIAQGAVLSDPIVTGIANTLGKTPAQVVLRWHIELGTIIFPKSSSAKRLQENAGIFDFELSESDIGEISALNRNERTGPDPDTFNFIPS